MKNKIKAIFKTLVQDILKPFILYTLLCGSVFAIFFGTILGIVWIFNFFFPNNGETILYMIIQGLMIVFLIVLFVCYIIEYFKDTVIPNYKNKLKQLNNKDKNYWFASHFNI